MRPVFLLATLCFAAAPGFAAEQPKLVWSQPTDSIVQPAPLVAGLDALPGLEVICADAGGRQLLCLDAGGRELWRLDGPSGQPVSSAPALGRNAWPDKAVVAVAFGDTIACIDPAGPSLLWQHTDPGAHFERVLWFDMSGDTWQDVVAAGSNRIVVLDAQGAPLLQLSGEDGEVPFALQGPVVAADVDGDGAGEIYALDSAGPFSLDSGGFERWRAAPGGIFTGAPALADANDDGVPELYAVAADGPGLYLLAFDADFGDVLWKTLLPGEPAPALHAALAAGDLDRGGTMEIVVADGAGRVHAVNAEGALLWTSAPGTAAPARISLGDVDGDAAVEVLAASEDGTLYALGAGGTVKWRYVTDRALTHAPAICGLNENKQAGIVFGGRDQFVRCITLEGRFMPGLLPWPMDGADPARTGSSLASRSEDFGDAADAAAGDAPVTVMDSLPLLPLGGFDAVAPGAEAGAPPLGWTRESAGEAAWGCDSETKRTGESALKVEAVGQPCVIVSEMTPVDPGLRSVNVSVMKRGGGAAAAVLRWTGAGGILREDPLVPAGSPDDGWQRLQLPRAEPPQGAQWLSLALETAPGAPAWWDAAQAAGQFEWLPEAGVHCNQLGYEMGAPKHFTAYGNFMAMEAVFELLTDSGEVAHSGRLGQAARITGPYGRDWGHYYARGDFSAFDTPGTYRIRVAMDGISAESQPFEIAADLYWQRGVPAVLGYLGYMRSGVDIPNFHEAWHLDDARDPETGAQLPLHGGWYDDGRLDKRRNTAVLTALARAQMIAGWRFDQMAGGADEESALMEALRWGADYVARLQAEDGALYEGVARTPRYMGAPGRDTDNVPDSGDERVAVRGGAADEHAYALALAAAALGGDSLAHARAALDAALERELKQPAVFAAAMQLYSLTEDEAAMGAAQALFPGMAMDRSYLPYTESLIAYEDTFMDFISVKLANEHIGYAGALLTLANNPFGVASYGPVNQPHFFAPRGLPAGDALGNTAHLLRMAISVAHANRFTPKDEYRAFIHDQLNWILGNNPAGVSLVEGLGHTFLPAYHSHAVFAGIARGALPGAIANGFVPRGPGDGRPFIDLRAVDLPDARTNACAAENAALFIELMAHLKRTAFMRGPARM